MREGTAVRALILSDTLVTDKQVKSGRRRAGVMKFISDFGWFDFTNEGGVEPLNIWSGMRLTRKCHLRDLPCGLCSRAFQSMNISRSKSIRDGKPVTGRLYLRRLRAGRRA